MVLDIVSILHDVQKLLSKICEFKHVLVNYTIPVCMTTNYIIMLLSPDLPTRIVNQFFRKHNYSNSSVFRD